MAPKDKYTDPELRDQVKEEIHNSDKGGKPGQWSARKAQMMASEYKKRGGGYNTSKEEGQSESQKHLNQWTNEEWQTKEGSGTARQEDGSRKRYLPKKAWEQMSEEEKNDTEEKKVSESKKGKQFVGNTSKAKSARKNASQDQSDSQDENQVEDEGQDENKPQTRKQTRESGQRKEDAKGTSNDEVDSGQSDNKTNGVAGTKRSAKQSNKSNKKQKEDDETPAVEKDAQGSGDDEQEYQESDDAEYQGEDAEGEEEGEEGKGEE